MNPYIKVKGLLLAALVGVGAVQDAAARAPEKTSGPRRADLAKTAAGCTDATAVIDLDINNVRARIMTGGDAWWDRGTGEARYEIPKGSRKNSLYAGALWVGGIDAQDQLKVTAQLYRSGGNDYWTGPMDANNGIDLATCLAWDRFWKVNRADIIAFREVTGGGIPTDPRFKDIIEWPAKGNVLAKGAGGEPLLGSMVPGRDYAPYVDVDGVDGYDPLAGDYPGVLTCQGVFDYPPGDQYIWSIYNDVGGTKTQTGTAGIGLEIQRSCFAYSTKDFLNDATFYNYKLINRGALRLDSCYTSTWTDADLGFAFDDFIGCDTARGLGILYNGKATDGAGEITSYGDNPPMVGVDFFIGPRKSYIDAAGVPRDSLLKMTNFTYFKIGSGAPAAIQDPTTGIEFYRYMTGSNRLGDPFSFDFKGDGIITQGFGEGPKINFVYTGEPDVPGSWSEANGLPAQVPSDRRFVHSAGPFVLEGGNVTNDITIGACWVSEAGGGKTSFQKIRVADDLIQELFDNCFVTIEGPESPDLTIREMDQKLIVYLTNPPGSNNYKEQYGYNIDSAIYRVSSGKTRDYGGADSLYKFEGYRVFQLANAEITAAQIFDEEGEVDQRVAREVFQCDIRNNVKQIRNYAKNTKVSGVEEYDVQVKVNGEDSGIRHSFVLENDAFASGENTRLVNYRTYYLVAVAYGYNNFAQFVKEAAGSTQDRAYLESSSGAKQTPIIVYTAMPNPANGDMGTVLNADYGSGVPIKRLEGWGNGGNNIQLDTETETFALTDPSYHKKDPTYVPGAGPVAVSVIDPLKVQEADYELYIEGPTSAQDVIFPDPTPRRIIRDDSGSWRLVINTPTGTQTTVYNERNLRLLNEQILADYGLAVSIVQRARPQEDSTTGRNGYVTSDISYEDNGKIWLAGVPDEEDRSNRNWIRAGNTFQPDDNPPDCEIGDIGGGSADAADPQQAYENLLANNSLTAGTWAPYFLAWKNVDAECGFGVGNPQASPPNMLGLQGVDVVFTADKTKWSRCIVLEMQDDSSLSQGNAPKFKLRRSAGWNMAMAGAAPEYSTNAADDGMSYFPGYAINQETGERLNIFFAEDSWQVSNNGRDMLWNPTGTLLSNFGDPIFGGKHYVYVSSTKYDGCATIRTEITNPSPIINRRPLANTMWVGAPLVANANQMRSYADGYIPTTTRLRFRVARPYASYPGLAPAEVKNNNFPRYSFTTRGMAPTSFAASGGGDRQKILDMIGVTPNPYFAYTPYENNRLDTRVRIIHLPKAANISIYSLDGTLVRRLSKDNANVSYVDWDLRNARGLPIASGMYLIHVDAVGIGEVVLKWFGALRPVDATNY